MLKHMPVHRDSSPALRLLLGLANNVHSKHKECVQKRIEKLSSNETTAQQNSLFAQIKFDDTMIAHDDLKKETSTAVEQMSNAIGRLKSKNIRKEDKKELEVIRKPLKNENRLK